MVGGISKSDLSPYLIFIFVWCFYLGEMKVGGFRSSIRGENFSAPLGSRLISRETLPATIGGKCYLFIVIDRCIPYNTLSRPIAWVARRNRDTELVGEVSTPPARWRLDRV
jgi:hypothetical protein